jgi:hypothetical protein
MAVDTGSRGRARIACADGRKPARQLFLSLAILLLASTVASGQPTVKSNSGKLSMKSVEALNQKGIGPKLIGGREAKSADWPASFYSEAAANGSRCTATLVGPRALLLAAHCVGNGEEVAIEFRGAAFSGTCTHAEDYKNGTGDPSADYALCLMAKPVSGIKFETVNLDPARIKIGNSLLLTGYGCTQAPIQDGDEPSGGNDGKYRIGEAKIVALPADPGNEPNTILTRDKTAICPGDSGGGAYFVLTSTRRQIVSVNSRILFSKGESYLSSLSSTDGLAFVAKWIKDNKSEKICGVNVKDATCR